MTIANLARTDDFRGYLSDLLVEICAIDTTPRTDVADLAGAEAKVFDVLERHLATYGLPGCRAERRPMNPAIADHPFFSQLYYTVSPERPQGLDAKATYRGRSNLLVMVDGQRQNGPGVNQAINAHIDVVHPYFPPRVEGGKILGRGACDDKGAIVAFMGAMKLVAAHLKKTGQKLSRNLTGMVVIEEEMGGNGSLSLALDRELRKRYDSLMVLECCGGNIHPGNRGALWYKIETRQAGDWMNLLEAVAFVIEELEKEGRSIRAESDHPLFPHRPVQTCHGMIGRFGQHPSRILGRVDFTIAFTSPNEDKLKLELRTKKTVTDVIEFAIAEYIGVYGDKTKAKDASGKPKVDHHYDLLDKDGALLVQVHGATGHMGSIFENDGAMTKMMTIIRALIRSRAAIENAAGGRGRMKLTLLGHEDPGHLVLEGGQGFLPTHDMPQIMRRMTAAVHRGATHYAIACGRGDVSGLADCFKVTFDKLHNAAFAGRADSPDMANATAAAREAGVKAEGPVRGWDVSCDARIFACEYPDLPVLTSGPGLLTYAHSDTEQVEIADVAQAAEFLAHFILKQTGTAT